MQNDSTKLTIDAVAITQPAGTQLTDAHAPEAAEAHASDATAAIDATVAIDPERDIVERAVHGDQLAFEALYRKYLKRVFNICFRMVGSMEEAEEVTQETFFQAYKSLANFQMNSRFYTWLFRIATNVALQYVKRRYRRNQQSSYEELEEAQIPMPVTPSAGTCPDREIDHKDFTEQLKAAIDQLVPNQRIVMILGPIQGKSYLEVAQILGTSEDVIKGRIHRARENLRQILKDFRVAEPKPAKAERPAKPAAAKVLPLTGVELASVAVAARKPLKIA